jgi:hypothetical protein
MNGVCLCCGTYGPAERHHVGGRVHSKVVTDVCQPCHQILSAWQSERRWSNDATVAARVIVETVDVLCVLTARGGFASAVSESLAALMLSSDLMTVRPASRVAEIPAAVTPDPLCDFDRFVIAAQLLRDVARVVMADVIMDAPPKALVQVVELIDALDYGRAYRAMSSQIRRESVQRQLEEMVVVTGETLANITGEDGLPPRLIAEVFRHAMGGYRDSLTVMVREDAQ